MVLRGQASAEVTQIGARHNDIGVQADEIATRDEDGAIARVARNAGAQLEGREALAILADEVDDLVAGLAGKGFDGRLRDAGTDTQGGVFGDRDAIGQVTADHIAGEAGTEADNAIRFSEEA